MKNILFIIPFIAFISSCATNQSNTSADSNVTVGVVQKEIKLGMSSVKVIEALGSPNIVQTDDDRNEVWIYDKITTEVRNSSSSASAWFLLFWANSREGSSSSSQRTLTIIIKFDKNQKVKDFSYHTSRF